MENNRYYRALVEQMFFASITPEGISSVANYLPSKSFKDLEEAFKQGRLDGLGSTGVEFECIAERLSRVVEIDVKMPFIDYIKRLRSQ